MQTAIAYSRILRQLASQKTEQDKQRADQRLQGVGSRSECSNPPSSARPQQNTQH